MTVPSFARPGVYVTEKPLPLSLPSTGSGQAIAAIIGYTREGPLAPTRVNSWSEYVNTYAAYIIDSPMHRAVYSAFAQGVGSAYIVRVVPSDARYATLSANDRLQTPFNVTANSPGAWGNSVSCKWEIDTTMSEAVGETRWKLTVERVGVPLTSLPEQFVNLSMNPDSGRFYKDVINNNSKMIRALEENKNTGPINVRTQNLSTPGGVLASASSSNGSTDTGLRLTGGSDGELNNDGFPYLRGDEGRYADAIHSLDVLEEENLLLYCADQPYMSSGRWLNIALASYAAGRGDSFAILDTPAGLTPRQAMDYSSLQTTYAAMYYPWIRVPNPNRTSTFGSTVLMPPGASVLGAISALEKAKGPWVAPAGPQIGLTGLNPSIGLGVEQSISASELDQMNTNARPINPIRAIPNQGVLIMGGRTQDSTSVARYVSVRRALNYYKQVLRRQARLALFRPITPSLMQEMVTLMSTTLGGFFLQGGLAGRVESEAFQVICDFSNNPPEDTNRGVLVIDVGLALLVPAEYVWLRVGQFEGQLQVAESQSGFELEV